MSTTTTIIVSFCLAIRIHSVLATSEGNHFVVSCPWLKHAGTCAARISTAHKEAKVNIKDIKEDVVLKSNDIAVYRGSPEKYPLDYNKDQKYDHSAPLENYPVSVIRSNWKIIVVVITRIEANLFQKCSAVLLMPKSSCGKNYYTVTANASPFFSVFTFDYSSTLVKATFPVSDPFQVYCFGSKDCAPNNTVEKTMYKYEGWYVTVNADNISLLNVLIESDNPVYVISGNRYGWIGIDFGSWDISTASLYSTKTWAMEYIVPKITESKMIFAVNTLTFPLTIKFTDDDGIFEYVLQSLQVEHYEYGKPSVSISVVGDAPFGLTLVFPSRLLGEQELGDVSILNIIPVGKWMQTVVYTDSGLSDNYRVTGFLLVKGTRSNVKFPTALEKDVGFKWHEGSVELSGKSYALAEFPLHADAQIRMGAGDTGILYVTFLPKDKNVICFATLPFEVGYSEHELAKKDNGRSIKWIFFPIFLFLIANCFLVFYIVSQRARRKSAENTEKASDKNVEKASDETGISGERDIFMKDAMEESNE